MAEENKGLDLICARFKFVTNKSFDNSYSAISQADLDGEFCT